MMRDSRNYDGGLQATFKGSGGTGFQDSVGACVLQAAGVIPDGMLVFLPSYSLLSRLTARWKACSVHMLGLNLLETVPYRNIPYKLCKMVAGLHSTIFVQWSRALLAKQHGKLEPFALDFTTGGVITASQFVMQETGLWGQLCVRKAVVCEPRGTGEAFDGVMAEYYEAVARGQGAIFLAICRGKV